MNLVSCFSLLLPHKYKITLKRKESIPPKFTLMVPMEHKLLNFKEPEAPKCLLPTVQVKPEPSE